MRSTGLALALSLFAACGPHADDPAGQELHVKLTNSYAETIFTITGTVGVAPGDPTPDPTDAGFQLGHVEPFFANKDLLNGDSAENGIYIARGTSIGVTSHCVVPALGNQTVDFDPILFKPSGSDMTLRLTFDYDIANLRFVMRNNGR